VTAFRLRLLTIACFSAAAVLSALAGEQGGPYFAGAVACFFAGVLTFFRWRRAERATVFAQKDKTSEGSQP
jgi:hypothetical protein